MVIPEINIGMVVEKRMENKGNSMTQALHVLRYACGMPKSKTQAKVMKPIAP